MLYRTLQAKAVKYRVMGKALGLAYHSNTVQSHLMSKQAYTGMCTGREGGEWENGCPPAFYTYQAMAPFSQDMNLPNDSWDQLRSVGVQNREGNGSGYSRTNWKHQQPMPGRNTPVLRVGLDCIDTKRKQVSNLKYCTADLYSDTFLSSLLHSNFMPVTMTLLQSMFFSHTLVFTCTNGVVVTSK